MNAPSSSATALEAELSPELRYVLRDAMTELGIDHPEWPQVPALRLFETLAVSRLARRVRTEEDCSQERALMTACVRLGVGYDAARMRLYRASSTLPRSA
jgi:hypothetical protein